MTETEVKAIAANIAKEAIEAYMKEQGSKEVSDWAGAYWNEAVAAGIFDGTMPRSGLTREQAATTYNKMGLLGLSQDKEVSGWAKEAWDQLVEIGLLDGTGPRNPMTREQFAVVTAKILRQLDGAVDQEAQGK